MDRTVAARLAENIERVILGKPQAIEHVLIALFAEGHILLEDIPGVGKTMLARSLARSIDLSFRRVQFTSDLLPADILGVSVLRPETGEFQFRKGPIFAHVVVADELNRTPPRTQSSLLEALEDHRVTVDGETRDLPAPFLVVATQNPLEFAGTYPLPESELDRFLLCSSMGYPDREHELRIVKERRAAAPIDDLAPVVTAEDIETERESVRQVRVDDAVLEYLLDVVEATRRDGRVRLGASPRAAIGFERAVRARARVRGRDYAIPEDVKELALPVLGHRVLVSGVGEDLGRGPVHQVLAEILDRLAVPV